MGKTHVDHFPNKVGEFVEYPQDYRFSVEYKQVEIPKDVAVMWLFSLGLSIWNKQAVCVHDDYNPRVLVYQHDFTWYLLIHEYKGA